MIRFTFLLKVLASVCAVFVLGAAPLQANDCTTAVPITLSANGACAFSAPASFTNSGIPTFGNPGGCGIGAASHAWFQLNLGTPGLQHDVRVTITLDFPGNVKGFLSSSEASETGSGSPCYFPGFANGDIFNLRENICMVAPAGGGTFSFETGGLDGSATYFVILERVTGTGGNATVCVEGLATGLPPGNDRCTTPITLAVGSGIDANTATGGTGTWSYGLDGNTRYATKQRMPNGCAGPSRTEDHFFFDGFSAWLLLQPVIGHPNGGRFSAGMPCQYPKLRFLPV